MTSETLYNLTQVAELTKLSLPTLRKYLRENRFPNAKQATKGKVLVWAIPLTDLVAAELIDRVTGLNTASAAVAAPLSREDRLEALAERAGRLEAELASMRETVEVLKDSLEQAKKAAQFAQLVAQSQIETKQVQDNRAQNWLERLTGKKPETKQPTLTPDQP